MMTLSSEQKPLPEIIALYTALLADAASMSERRQNMNTIYLSLNGLFLTAIGWLLITSHFTSGWVVGATLIITLAVAPINVAWLRMLQQYQGWLNTRYTTMHEIEIKHRFAEQLLGRGGQPTSPDPLPLVGQNILSARPLTSTQMSMGLASSSALEMSLPRYFLLVYPLVTLGTLALIVLISNGFIPAFGL